MTALKLRSVAAAILLAAALPVAASGVVSSPSESVAQSVGSVSDSIKRSSDSSSNTVGLAEGDYRITQVALVDERPAMTRLTLQAAAGEGTDAVYLYVPTKTADQYQLAAGGQITARHREYGIEFTQARAAEPFFLVVNDDVQRELGNHVVAL